MTFKSYMGLFKNDVKFGGLKNCDSIRRCRTIRFCRSPSKIKQGWIKKIVIWRYFWTTPDVIFEPPLTSLSYLVHINFIVLEILIINKLQIFSSSQIFSLHRLQSTFSPDFIDYFQHHLTIHSAGCNNNSLFCIWRETFSMNLLL